MCEFEVPDKIEMNELVNQNYICSYIILKNKKKSFDPRDRF